MQEQQQTINCFVILNYKAKHDIINFSLISNNKHCFLLLFGGLAPTVSLHCFLLFGGMSHPQCLCAASSCRGEGDVAPTVSLCCFLLSGWGGCHTHSVSALLLVVGVGEMSHPQCLCAASCCQGGGTSHPQCLCTASCFSLGGTSHPQCLCTASCLHLQ